jgi:serine/threonine-protein kinase
MASRMLTEARIIARLEHPGIVPVHDVGTLPDGRTFYTMKLVQGNRLDQAVHELDSLYDKLRLFLKICDAISFAHAHGVIHRDLKPANVMVGPFGEVLVMDWGLAKIVAESRGQSAEGKERGMESEERKAESVERRAHGEEEEEYAMNKDGWHSLRMPHETRHGAVIGTPAFMAPEQQRGEIDQIDQRTDVYALGAILSFLLNTSGKVRLAHTSSKVGLAQEESAILSTNTSASPTLPPAKPHKIAKPLAAMCAKALAADKAGRYERALDLAGDIERFIDDLSVSAYKENLLEKSWRWLKRYKFMVFLVVVYMIVRIILFFGLRP